MAEHQVQIWHDGMNKRLKSMTAEVDPGNSREISRLLRGEAAALRYHVEHISARIWDPSSKKWVTHRV